MNHEDNDFYSRDQFFRKGLKYVQKQRKREANWRRERREHNAEEEAEREDAREVELLKGKIKREELKEQLFEYIGAENM